MATIIPMRRTGGLGTLLPPPPELGPGDYGPIDVSRLPLPPVEYVIDAESPFEESVPVFRTTAYGNMPGGSMFWMLAALAGVLLLSDNKKNSTSRRRR